MRSYNVTNIEYDTDGIKVKLPKSMVVEIPDDIGDSYDEISEFISDAISNRTSYCHKGFSFNYFMYIAHGVVDEMKIEHIEGEMKLPFQDTGFSSLENSKP